MECHHVVQEGDGGPDTFENCIPLCFDCHADMKYDIKHPKGTKYQPNELVQHRDRWYQKVVAGGGAGVLQAHLDIDSHVFEEFEKAVSYSPSIRLLAEHDFRASFERAMLEPLGRYLNSADRVHFEFLDSILEGARGDLVSSIRALYAVLSPNIFPTNSRGEYSVPVEWRRDSPERYEEATSAINEAAKACVLRYNTLVRTVRQRLGVPGHSEFS